MVALKMNEQPIRALPIDIRHLGRLAPGHGWACDAVTPTDDGPTTWRALRVLIVDDEQEPTGGLSARVEAWGHAARRAGQGRAARILAAGERPDVVLLNLEPSSMGGRRLAEQLRHGAPRTDCLIIGVADWADDERRRKCSEAGIDLLLVDPFDPSVLEALLWLECVRTNRQRSGGGQQKEPPIAACARKVAGRPTGGQVQTGKLRPDGHVAGALINKSHGSESCRPGCLTN